MRFRTALCTLVTAALPLWAHAVLLEGSPKAGTVVAGPAFPVNLRFNSRIDARRSRLSLVDASGEEQPLSLTQSAPDTVTAHALGAKPGRNRIRWQVLSSDGHITRGEIQFQVQ